MIFIETINVCVLYNCQKSCPHCIHTIYNDYVCAFIHSNTYSSIDSVSYHMTTQTHRIVDDDSYIISILVYS